MTLGFFGFAAPTDAIIVDLWGLTDPLLARLPAENPTIGASAMWRAWCPRGIWKPWRRERTSSRTSVWVKYYERLSLITRGPLFSWERLKTIWRFNLGFYDHLLKPAI